MTADTIAKLLAGKDASRPALGAPGAARHTILDSQTCKGIEESPFTP